MGWMAVVYGFSVLLMTLIPNPLIGRIAILGIAVFLLVVGIALIAYSRTKRRSTQ